MKKEYLFTLIVCCVIATIITAALLFSFIVMICSLLGTRVMVGPALYCSIAPAIVTGLYWFISEV